MMTNRLTALACMVCLLAGVSTSHAAGGWEVIDRTDEGYEIARRPQPGQEVPTFRGRGVLDGDILHILAVLLDCTRATEWAEGASRMKVLKQEGVVTTLLYTYSELTWPVSDRDVITSAKLHVIKKGEEYKLVMKAQPKALPENEDVVRITRSDAHFHLKKQADGKVWIEYQVDVDPGGKLPKWLVTWASKKVPANTLRNVQKQVKKTQGDYDKVIPKIAALS